MEQLYLKNGLRVIYYQLPHTHSISVSLNIKAGSMYEKAEENGITHLLEHIHFRQLGKRKQDELYYSMECMGTTLMASTYRDLLQFYFKIRPDYLFGGISILSDILKPTFWTEDLLKQEKQVVINQLLEGQYYYSAEQYAREIVWKECGLSQPIIGTVETIEKIQLPDLFAFKNKILTADNICLIITGSVTKQQIEEINSLFSSIELPDFADQQFSLPTIQFSREPDVKLVELSWEYLDVMLSFDVNLDVVTEEELSFLNLIIGDGDGSVLSRTIREKQGYTAEIISYTETYSKKAVMNIKYTVFVDKFYECLKHILILLKKAKDNIDDFEMRRNRVFFTDNVWYYLDNPEDLNYKLCREMFVGNKKDFDLNKQIERFSDITSEQIIKAANEIFCSKNVAITVLGDMTGLSERCIQETVIKILE